MLHEKGEKEDLLGVEEGRKGVVQKWTFLKRWITRP